MSQKRGYEILILLTYIAMSAVCIYLQFFSQGQAGSISNLIVNVTMLVISGIILTACVIGGLIPTSSVTADLITVSERIEEDAKTARGYLWDKYLKDKDDLFEDRRLLKNYKGLQILFPNFSLFSRRYSSNLPSSMARRMSAIR